ncbi:hypothetical protein L1887_58279 [Cichorium endivia]|nr:hypothetical protein L1887_58279 [Cichorium endivia]
MTGAGCCDGPGSLELKFCCRLAAFHLHASNVVRARKAHAIASAAIRRASKRMNMASQELRLCFFSTCSLLGFGIQAAACRLLGNQGRNKVLEHETQRLAEIESARCRPSWRFGHHSAYAPRSSVPFQLATFTSAFPLARQLSIPKPKDRAASSPRAAKNALKALCLVSKPNGPSASSDKTFTTSSRKTQGSLPTFGKGLALVPR